MNERETMPLVVYQKIARVSADESIFIFDLDNVLLDESISQKEKEQHYTYLKNSGISTHEIS